MVNGLQNNYMIQYVLKFMSYFLFPLGVIILVCIPFMHGTLASTTNNSDTVYDPQSGTWVMGGTISGSVIKVSHQPVINAVVAIYTNTKKDLCLGQSKTNKKGQFCIRGINQGQYYMHVDASIDPTQNLINVWWDGMNGSCELSHAKPISIQNGQNLSSIQLILHEGNMIYGTIKTSHNEPIANICVTTFQSCDNQTITSFSQSNQKGHFLISGIPDGQYYLKTSQFCSENPRQFIDQWWDGKSGAQTCYQSKPILVKNRQTISDIHFSLNEIGTVSGMISNNKGEPLADICVYAMNQCGKKWYGNGISNQDGIYTITHLAPGDYFLRTDALCDTLTHYIDEWWDGSSGTRHCKTAKPVYLRSPKKKSNISFTLDSGGSIAGHILTPDKFPIPNVCVIASARQCSTILYGNAVTDENGHYMMNLPPGDYYLSTDSSCESPQFIVNYYWNDYHQTGICQNASSVQVAKNKTKQKLDFYLPIGGLISGKVTSMDDNPIPDIRIVVSNQCNQVQFFETRTNEKGLYSIIIPEGTVYISTDSLTESKHDYVDKWWDGGYGTSNCSEAIPISIVSHEQNVSIDFSLEKTSHISGMISNTEGQPLSNIQVIASNYCGQTIFNQAITNKQGLYHLIVAPGDYYIHTENIDSSMYYVQKWFSDTGDTTNCHMAKMIRCDAGQDISTIHLSLNLGGHVIGRVVANSGSPVPYVCVVAKTASADIPLAKGITDENGFYSITGIPPGLCLVEVDASCSYQVNYSDEWIHGAVVEQKVLVKPHKTSSGVDFILFEGGSVSGSVFSSNNTALGDICIIASQSCGEQFFSKTNTDDKGQFILRGLPSGHYLIHTQAACKDNSPLIYMDQWWHSQKIVLNCKDAEPVHVITGHTTSSIQFTMKSFAVIAGKLLSPEGNGIPNVCIIAKSDCNDIIVSETTSDQFGNYTIMGLRPGNYYIGTDVTCIEEMNYKDKWWHSDQGNHLCDTAETIAVTSDSNQLKPIDFHLHPYQRFKPMLIAPEPLKDGEYSENVDGGKVTLVIKDKKIDLIVNQVSLENVLRIIEKRTDLKILLFGTLDEKLSFKKHQVPLDELLQDLLNGRAGHIFIYSPGRLITSYIFSKDGKLSRKQPFQPENPIGLEEPKQDVNHITDLEINDLLTRPGNTEEKIHLMAQFIGQYDSQKCVDLLSLVKLDPDEEVRMMAISLLNDIKENHLSVDPLCSYLEKDNSPAVRALSAEALANIGDKRAVRPLMEALNDRDAGVREIARQALKELTGTDPIVPEKKE